MRVPKFDAEGRRYIVLELREVELRLKAREKKDD